MAKPIAVTDGICFAFPDVLLTPAPPGPPVPIPYPNIAQLADATDTAETVNAGGKAVILEGSSIASSSGGEAGSSNPIHLDECTFTQASGTVTANGQGIVRQLDTTSQNAGNAVGMVMSGNATVLVGD
jgi:hypothetical protein